LEERLRGASTREQKIRAVLSLKVCDLASGSGHFLLAAARRLGKELARVNTGEDEPSPERVREAIRDVITHCIYGVDKNPLAVELCRVALWLEGHAEDKPLTFLDHRIRCGDSLVGVFDLKVFEQGIPDEAFKPVAGEDRTIAREAKTRNTRERAESLLHFPVAERLKEFARSLQELDELPEDTIEQVRAKTEAYRRVESSPEFERLRAACNIWTAAFFQVFSNGATGLLTTDALRKTLDTGRLSDNRLVGWIEATAVERRFFHWTLAFPEIVAAGGFDVFLGNPPFLGGQRISGEFGDKYRQILATLYEPFIATADLCAAFFHRGADLLRQRGRLGLIATNTISQGDTRLSGLAVLVRRGDSIEFASRFVKWPGMANVEVNLLCLQKGGSPVHKLLDTVEVDFISSRLDSEPEAEPQTLRQNENKTFQGSILQGIGFVLDTAEAERLIHANAKNGKCLFRYLNGDDLNSEIEQQPSRWVINFFDWPLDKAEDWPDLIQIVRQRVKPERDGIRRERNRLRWWIYAETRPGLYSAIRSLRRVLVRTRHSELHFVAFVPNGWVYSDALVVFAYDDYFHFALLQSNVHEAWLRREMSTIRTDARYTTTTCFETFSFPQPLNVDTRADADRYGEAYDEHRRQTMLVRQLGLTKTYNLFHNPQCADVDIASLRELHAKMDRAILACYGWTDIDPGHGFHANERGQTRYTISPTARRELLRRLLALNLEIAAHEAAGETPGRRG
jgi:Eco57I restriction-modification methylase/MmeI, target recognition domain